MSESCIKRIESYWKVETTISNGNFDKANYENALTGYLEAFYRAEVLSNNFMDCLRFDVPFIQIYLISCNNLAHTYEELNKIEQARNVFCQGIKYLLHIEEKMVFNSHEVQLELKKAALNYINFVKKYKLDKAGQDNFIDELKMRYKLKYN